MITYILVGLGIFTIGVLVGVLIYVAAIGATEKELEDYRRRADSYASKVRRGKW